MRVFATSAALVVLAANPAHASDWDLNCKADKMTDKTNCSLAARKHEGPPRHRFVLVGYESGMLIVSAGRRGGEARLRVDGNSAIITRDCKGEYCVFSKPQTITALQQMRSGSRLMADYATSEGVVGPMEFSLSGFDGLYQEMQAKQRR
jgi:invasion protein IalB